jgi:hypothetical protein
MINNTSTNEAHYKQQIEEQNNQDKTDTTPNITPQKTKEIKKATGTDERSEKRNITQNKYIRNAESIPYYEGDELA